MFTWNERSKASIRWSTGDIEATKILCRTQSEILRIGGRGFGMARRIIACFFLHSMETEITTSRENMWNETEKNDKEKKNRVSWTKRALRIQWNMIITSVFYYIHSNRNIIDTEIIWNDTQAEYRRTKNKKTKPKHISVIRWNV